MSCVIGSNFHLESSIYLDNVFDNAIEIANSIYEVCNTLAALVSASDTTSSCHALVLQLSQISSYCGLSYLSLVTTYDVEAVASTVFGGPKPRIIPKKEKTEEKTFKRRGRYFVAAQLVAVVFLTYVDI
ncbi:hypothetical protein QL285_009463 [Trifolium repens]|nr:hypothetical protein QL285_009463 [Trifolium repens]